MPIEAILDIFFYAYGAILDSFVSVSVFRGAHCIPQNYRWL